MNLLLDTHIFIWWDSQSASLSASARNLCDDPNNTLYLSLTSVWEMQIKQQLGKLELTRPLDVLIAEQQHVNGLRILPIQLDHILALGNLPAHHRDPFDRLLIAQAQTEGMSLISDDALLKQYDVIVLS